ncbi:hypothetical protein K435DRAFT_32710 [Dendrothele bispora CBS 962.96]|uniref:Uncharacterized protein n=1 Tax=Dendrothele bispora (strain CBS 962.96) TaxID=1314807 RepID=A0A4S8M912_DENBC|nr:hypothetical protein K435DRAFT_32710 [Dendrothele bispora CBS 962.96]
MSPAIAAATPSNENDIKKSKTLQDHFLLPSTTNFTTPLHIDSVYSSHSHFFSRRLLSFSDGLKCIMRRSRLKSHSSRFFTAYYVNSRCRFLYRGVFLILLGRNRRFFS